MWVGLVLALPSVVGCEQRVVRRSWHTPYAAAGEAQRDEAPDRGGLPLMQPPRRDAGQRDESGDGFFESIEAFLFGEPPGREQRHPAVQSLPNEINTPLPTRDPNWPGNRGPSRSAE